MVRSNAKKKQHSSKSPSDVTEVPMPVVVRMHWLYRSTHAGFLPTAPRFEHVQRRNTDLLVAFSLELPVLVDGLDGPVELLAQSLREEALDGDVELLREDDGETRIDIVLQCVSRARCQVMYNKPTIFDVPKATSLLPSLSSICIFMFSMR
jgi:hypothetical protein